MTEIRQASAGDAEAVAGFVVSHASEAGSEPRDRGSVAREVRDLLGRDDYLVLIVEEEGAMRGLLTMRIQLSLLDPSPAACVGEMLVEGEDVPGELTGRLLSGAIEYAKEFGCGALEVHALSGDAAVLAFYQSHGFGREAELMALRF